MDIFRIVFTIVFFLNAIPVFRYRRKAQAGEKFDTSGEGWIFVPLRLFGLAIWLYFLVYIFYAPILAWSFMEMPDWLRWTGGGIGLIVTPPLINWAQAHLGKNVSTTVITRENHQLITTGPYNYIRHPLYTTGILFFLSLALLSASWFLLTVMGLGLVMILFRTPIEEAELEKRFGPPYVEYKKRTGMFFPKIKSD